MRLQGIAGGPGPVPGKWIALIIALIAVDQCIKVYAFRTMAPHENVRLLGRWIVLRLELNDGTALGFPFVNELDRYLRILLKAALASVVFYLLLVFRRRHNSRLFATGLALSVAGLTGNLIDRVVYGVLLGNSLPGYATPWFHGRIVDMLSCPPVFGPVFNFADMLSTVGGVLALVGLMRLRHGQPVPAT